MKRNLLIIFGLFMLLASVACAQGNTALKPEGILPAEVPNALKLCESYADLIKKGAYHEAIDRYNFYSSNVDAEMKARIQKEFIANMANFVKANGPIQSFQFDRYSFSNMMNLPGGRVLPRNVAVYYSGILKDGHQSKVTFQVIKIDNAFKILSFEMKMMKKT